jgi:hypothetical protein
LPIIVNERLRHGGRFKRIDLATQSDHRHTILTANIDSAESSV